MINNTQSTYLYEYSLNGLNLGTYSYLTIARDYANNTSIFYNTHNFFKIKQDSNVKEILVFMSIISFTCGFIGFVIYINYNLYKRINSKRKEKQI